jgi:hypothetical protein
VCQDRPMKAAMGKIICSERIDGHGKHGLYKIIKSGHQRTLSLQVVTFK